MTARGIKAALLRVHRYISLCLLLFWVVQLLTGTYLVYARTLDDVALGARGQPMSPASIDRAVDAIERPGRRVLQYFVSGGIAGQVDMLVQDDESGLRVWRVDGMTGRVERVTAWDGRVSDMPLARSALLLHKSLLAGGTGRLMLIGSGTVLLLNLLIGLTLAWPARRRWASALMPRRSPNPIATWYGWHRALGLWVLPFALMATTTGLGLLFIPSLERLTDSRATPPPACRAAQPGASMAPSASAIASASRVFPGASVVVVSFPTDASNCYDIQMRQPGEWRRVFGTSRAYVDARSLEPAGSWNAETASLPARMVVALYTLHSGGYGGELSRVATILLALGLLTTMIAGSCLWWTRRRALARASAAAAQRKREVSPAA